MGDVGRRAFLRTGALAVGAAAIGRSERARAGSTGPALVADPRGLLDLPEGFSYRILQQSGARMDDGYRVPGRPDAMGCFAAPDGQLVLMRNHEMTRGDWGHGPYFPGQKPPPEAYDPEGTGGVTRLVLDPKTLALKRSNLVLAGTFWNCAGGLSPWGWLSCEEIDDPGHGFVFLCDPNAESVQPPRRLHQYGRMRHEAATVHPKSSVAYLTEDRMTACFYRFVPDTPGKPFEGRLQALRVKGIDRYDLGQAPRGRALAIDWVDLPPSESDADDMRFRAQSLGAAIVRRGEGLWLADDDVYFCATAGGPLGLGQVLRVKTGGEESVEVVAHSEDPEALNMPDNLTVSPSGQVYVAEDSMWRNHIRRIELDGSAIAVARNARSQGEFAGVCFSPDGGTMFVNMQLEGVTLAIRGPFPTLAADTVSEAAEQPQSAENAGAVSGLPPLAGRGVGTGLAVIALAALARRKRQQKS